MLLIRLALAAALVGCLAAAALAGTVNGYTFATPIASSFCSFTPTSSTSLTTGCTAIPTGAVCVLIDVTGQNVNWRDDTSAATATPGAGGHQLAASASMWYCGKLSNLTFFQQSATAVVAVSFYK